MPGTNTSSALERQESNRGIVAVEQSDETEAGAGSFGIAVPIRETIRKRQELPSEDGGLPKT